MHFVLSHNSEKSYVHFDKRVSLAHPSIRNYVLNTEKIKTHSFYPFIHFTKKIQHFKKTELKEKKENYIMQPI
jgi:hypothetical protein